MNSAQETAGMPRLVDKDDSVLFVIDAQERLVPAMSDGGAAVERIAILGEAARIMGVPTLLTEQYPKGLGHTVPELGQLATSNDVIEKTKFGAGEIEAVRDWLEATGRRQVILTGFESHVCVFQSAATLHRAGYEVCVAADAVSSRRDSDRNIALDRLARAGVTIVTSEMVIFEWLEAAGVPGFKELSRLIR